MSSASCGQPKPTKYHEVNQARKSISITEAKRALLKESKELLYLLAFLFSTKHQRRTLVTFGLSYNSRNSPPCGKFMS